MVFSSMTFVYAFFPLVVVAYYLGKSQIYRNTVLLLASLLFYSWGEPKFLILMIAAALTAYLAGLVMARGRHRKAVMVLAAAILVGNLLVFKYLGFFAENLGIPLKPIALPIGISFYTFQILSYVIDLYRGKIRVQRNFWYLLLYVSFFPQLIAGPIVRYETVEQEILDRKESLDGVTAGLRRFIVGLGKKVILANHIALLPQAVYQGDPAVFGTAMYWIAAISYALQIYFDFSGYSDMAIGLGRMFGFHFLENFDHPYLSLSVTEFWRRWHISLGSWFRDYVYIPLGGNRVSKPRWILNLLIVWALTGFWHGAQWNFLLWGLYYGLLLLGEKLLWGRALERLPKVLRWAYTAFWILLGWVLFDRAELRDLTRTLAMLFAGRATDWNAVAAENVSILKSLVYLPLGVLCCLPWKRPKWKGTGALILENGLSLALLGLSIVYILSSSYNPFIYFRF